MMQTMINDQRLERAQAASLAVFVCAEIVEAAGKDERLAYARTALDGIASALRDQAPKIAVEAVRGAEGLGQGTC